MTRNRRDFLACTFAAGTAAIGSLILPTAADAASIGYGSFWYQKLVWELKMADWYVHFLIPKRARMWTFYTSDSKLQPVLLASDRDRYGVDRQNDAVWILTGGRARMKYSKDPRWIGGYHETDLTWFRGHLSVKYTF